MCHQHTDDTSPHVLGVDDVTATIQGPVSTFFCSLRGFYKFPIFKTIAIDLTPDDSFMRPANLLASPLSSLLCNARDDPTMDKRLASL